MRPVNWTKITARIREIRKKSGLNQTDFGRRLGGVPQAVVSKYERGSVKPPMEFLIAVADLGKVSLDWLIRGKK